jgi:hypothetical protein
MYKPSIYLVVTYFRRYLPIYMRLISYNIGYQGEMVTIRVKWLSTVLGK